jgi:RecJ-like exonuclease
MRCPKCKGKGQVVRLGTVFRKCPLCHGAGRLTAERMEQIRQSKLLEDLRMSLGWCMDQAAKACKLTTLAYNDAEHGRRDPGPCMKALRRAGARTI